MRQLKMQKKKQIKIVYFLGLLIFVFFAFYSYYFGLKEYINDSVIAMILISIVYFFRKHLNLTSVSLVLLILGIGSHVAGVFGFYGASPIGVQYDHFTHFLGIFAVSIVLFNFFKKFFSDSRVNNFLILVMILFCSLGVGSLIEQTEYLGYLKFGAGPGLLKFGGLGDTPFDEENLRAMDVIGGGWLNTMVDLNYNFLGGLIGVLFMYYRSFLPNSLS